MRYLLINLVVLLGFCSCKPIEYAQEEDAIGIKVTYTNPYFANAAFDYVYKTDIAVYNQNFSGILIIKKIKEGLHRAVFTTQFGGTIFDFEFNKEDFKVHYILKDLDKKIIINIFKKDFKALIDETLDPIKAFETKAERIVKTKADKRFNYYFYDDSKNRLDSIKQTTKRKEKFSILFDKIDENVAEEITIQHHGIKLRMKLHLLKK
ncbi:hypothetical protein [Aquimarina rhabdastrellae]